MGPKRRLIIQTAYSHPEYEYDDIAETVACSYNYVWTTLTDHIWRLDPQDLADLVNGDIESVVEFVHEHTGIELEYETATTPETVAVEPQQGTLGDWQ